MTTIDGIDPQAAPSGDGCVECNATDGWWLHLRRCAQCGHIGCCDTSPPRTPPRTPTQHATAHAKENSHNLITSFEPGENWFWSYDTNEFYDGPELIGPQQHPPTQSTPGPKDRVPANWQDLLH